MSWFRNTITNLYNAVSAPVAATRDALASRLESVRESATLLYERVMDNIRYRQNKLKNIVEKEPLMGCGLLPECLRKKRFINALDTFDVCGDA